MKPSLQSVAKVLVMNEKEEVLILTIGEYKAHPEKSFTPDLPGGMVDPGETELTAVRRELQEEAGITVPEEAFVLAYAKTEFLSEKNKSATKFLYLTQLHTTPDVTLSWEHADFHWVSLEKLKAEIELRPFYREAVDYCFSAGLL